MKHTLTHTPRICDTCKVVRRNGRVMVVCKNGGHR